MTEQLEAKQLLAADLTGIPIEAFSIFSALSRGGDAMMAQAGINVAAAESTAPVVTDTATISAVDEIVANEVATIAEPIAAAPADTTTVDVTPTIETTPEPVAALPITEASGVLSATSFEEAEGEAGDIEITVGDRVLVIYNANTGFVSVTSEVLDVTTIEIVSESGIFTADEAFGLNGQFDVDSDTKLFKLSLEGFKDLSLGTVARPGLTAEFLADDLTISGSVAPQGGLSNKQVRVEVFATNEDGVRVTELRAGDEFFLVATVEDERPISLRTGGNVGVFAAYFDVTWNGTLAAPIGIPDFSSDFTTATSGTVRFNSLDEVGATSSSIEPTTDAALELFRQRMMATGGGTLQFSLNPADDNPGHEFLNFGSTGPIDVTSVTFDDDASVTIADSPTAPDLVAFAKALDAADAKFYGAGWCPACTAQKELFEDGQNFLPFIEVTNPDRSPNDIATQQGITSYPTWVFADGTRLEGQQTLQTLADAAGVAIPQDNAPTLIGLEDIDFFSGSPYHVPLDGYDPNGGALTYEVTVTGNSDITADVLEGNRSVEIDVAGYGSMVFELFDDEAPRATNQIATLAESGVYDGVIFHRILDDFVVQGGDPDGSGFGSSDLPDFDDQFDFDLQHNRPGILSMAKSFDDTNNSQFFITEVASRHLDFNHSVFGQLIEGESNRENISEVPVNGDGLPDRPVTMETVRIFDDIENGLLRLSAPEGTTGSATITVTVRDGEQHSYTESFDVNVTPDEINGGPFLLDFPEPTIQPGETFNLQLEGVDVEGDTILYGSFADNPEELDVDIVIETGAVTITPQPGFVGKSQITSSAYPPDDEPADTGDRFDAQIFNVNVPPGAPTIDLVTASDTGSSTVDNITNAETLEFEIDGVFVDAEVSLVANGNVIETVTATDTKIFISTSNLPEGTFEVTARQSVDELESPDATSVNVAIDRTSPDGFSSTPPADVFVREQLSYNVEHPEEGTADFRYSLDAAPNNATIDVDSGLIEWTPTESQIGNQTFTVVATDVAGNTVSDTFIVTATSEELLRVTLRAVDENGDVVSALPVGREFMLEVYVEDIRADAGDLQGVFATYVDVNYPGDLAQVSGDISYGSDFSNGQFGTTSAPGLIDDAGATSGGATPLGAGQFLLMSIPLRGLLSGTATFTMDPADDLPQLESLLNGTTAGLESDQIDFRTTSVEFVEMTFAVDDSVQTLEDSDNVLIRVLDNDIRIPANTTITVVSVGSASNGTVTINDDSSAVNYMPNANFNGTDNFTYTIEDESGERSTGTVTVEVIGVNDAPTANDDTLATREDRSAIEFDVLANDSISPDQDETLTITSVTPVANGDISVSNDGTRIIYTPAADFNGTETVQYTISDGEGGSDTASLTINVAEVNDAPVATRDIRTMDEDTTLTLNVSDLIGNDSAGPNESDQTLSIISVGTIDNATVDLNGSTITVTPDADFFGTVAFSYTVRDNGTTDGAASALTAIGTVTVNVTNVNDAPIAVDDSAIAQSGGGVISIDVLSNDTSGPDIGETLKLLSVTSGSAGGTVEIGADGTLNYTAPIDFSGSESFTYTLEDEGGATSTGIVVVDVNNFVPGGITGYSFFDADGDGLRATGEMALAGIRVSLDGTTDTGEVLSRSVQTDQFGFYEFEDLIPGTYTVTQTQPNFTVDGDVSVQGSDNVLAAANSFTVELGTEGAAGAEFNFTEQGLQPRFSIWEALASSGRAGMYSSVNVTGGQQWSQLESGWEGVQITNLEFNPARTAVTMTVIEDGETKSTTVPTSDASRLQIIGQDGDNYLVRIRGSRSAFDFS